MRNRHPQRVPGVLRRVVRRPADVEQARYQSVHIQIWFATTIACVIGLVAALLRGRPLRFVALWLAFAAVTGTATTVVARWSSLRGAVSAGIYAIVLTFTAVLFFFNTGIPYGLGYPGMLAVMVGATIAEAPRRAVWMGGISISLIVSHLALVAVQHHGNIPSRITGDSVGMMVALVALVFCGLMAATLWQQAMNEMNQRARENIALTTELRRAEQELEARVVARTDELTRRSEELRSRMAELRHALQERERLRGDLAEQAVRDELTGLHNRGRFMDALESLSESGGTFSLLLIDIDHFKSINDTFGHATGDQALVALTRQLAETVRTDDVVARVGGEEFGVLLPGTAQLEATAIAEAMRARVENHQWPPPLQERGVTISVGVAGTSRGDYVVPSKLMTRADRALYRAKALGRNRVVADQSLELAPGLGAGA